MNAARPANGGTIGIAQIDAGGLDIGLVGDPPSLRWITPGLMGATVAEEIAFCVRRV